MACNSCKPVFLAVPCYIVGVFMEWIDRCSRVKTRAILWCLQYKSNNLGCCGIYGVNLTTGPPFDGMRIERDRSNLNGNNSMISYYS